MRIFAHGAAIALMAPSILAAPLASAPSAAPVAAPAAQVQAGAAVAVPPPGMQMMEQAAQQHAAKLRHLHGAAFERAFMGAMIPHDAAAVGMAHRELTRGTRPPVKALAVEIITTLDREITQMTSWVRDWYHLTSAQAAQRAPASVRNADVTMVNRMRAMDGHLATAPRGSRFDVAFLTAMIAHHKMALIEASTVPGRATHSQLTGLARHIIATQRSQIGQMTAWLRTWHR
jgi:uncharacterized protein (DUF305 family)